MQSVIRKLFIAVLLLSAVQVNAQQDELFIPRNIQKAIKIKPETCRENQEVSFGRIMLNII